MRRHGTLRLLLVTGLACAHSPPAPTAGPVDVRAAIEAINAEFAAAMMKGDSVALGSMFTEDGEDIPNTMKGFISGRAALESFNAARFRAIRCLEVTITTVGVESSGDVAWETGTNRVVVQRGDAPPVTRTGRHLRAWKRGSDGRWRIRVDAVIPDPAG